MRRASLFPCTVSFCCPNQKTPAMLDICDSLKTLAVKRQLFHSEADFQHALAWQIQQLRPAAEIRLELPVAGETRRYLDIAVQDGTERVLIELKYTTREFRIRIGAEAFHLRDQRAQDVRRYDYLKDIERLESMLSEQVGTRGYAILLSNDHTYWTKGRTDTVDAAFRLHEDSLLSDTRHWDQNTAAGTMRGREDPIHLRGNYRNQWRDYARVGEGSGGEFRYLLQEIGPD
ncbi:MAG: hypothetical protein OXB89_03940 [Anaerolineaceae bacterium]|nr:hypothetical protein [Anaerolineaceae bacterium]